VKRRDFANIRTERRRAHRLNVVDLVELRMRVPQNEHAYSRSHASALFGPLLLYPNSHPTDGAQIFQKAWDLLSGAVNGILRIANSNLIALNTFGNRTHGNQA
jgi:hypothetical protein